MSHRDISDPGAFWDDKFDRRDYRYGTKPNPFVAATLPEVVPPPATVLCVGDGEGRNGVWCAEQGYQTTSLEPSAVGIKKITALAEERGVELEVLHDQMPSEAVDDNSFDVVVLSFIHTPPSLRPKVHQACADVLRPGGALLLEGFTPAQREQNRTSGGPPNIDLLFTPEMLREDFQSLQIEQLSEEVVELDAGSGHRGIADVVRLIARRPS